MIDFPSLAPSRFKLDTEGYRWNRGWPWTWGLMLRKRFQHSGCVDLGRIAEYISTGSQEQAWIRGLKDDVQNRIAPVATATGSTTKDPEETSNMDTMKDGVAYNWTSYQVTYGGMASKSAITPSSTSTVDDATLEDLWNSISRIFAGVEHIVSDIGQDVKDLFTTNTTSSDIYARLQQQLINSALDTVQNVADALLTALSLALSQFRAIGNQIIQIPIFSSLWKKITSGRDFTVINAFSLLLAIPSTLLYKIVKGKTPPSLKGMTKTDFSAYINKTPQDGVDAFPADAIAKVLGVMRLEVERAQTNFQTVKAFAAANTPADETIDTGLIFLGIGMAIHSWPVAGGNDMTLRWTVWILDCSNTLALAISRIVGWKTGTPSKVTAPLTETWAVMTSIPSFLLQILIITNGESGTIMTRLIVEGTFGMLKTWLSAIETVSPEGTTKMIAMGGKYLCLFIKSVMQFSDWWNAEGVIVSVNGGVIVSLCESDVNEKRKREVKAGSGRVKRLPASKGETEEKRKQEL